MNTENQPMRLLDHTLDGRPLPTPRSVDELLAEVRVSAMSPAEQMNAMRVRCTCDVDQAGCGVHGELAQHGAP